MAMTTALHPRFFADPGINRLARTMGWTVYHAIGVMTHFYHRSQAEFKDSCTVDDLAVWLTHGNWVESDYSKLLTALEGSGFIRPTDQPGLFVIAGAKDELNRLRAYKQRSKAGNEAKAKKRAARDEPVPGHDSPPRNPTSKPSRTPSRNPLRLPVTVTVTDAVTVTDSETEKDHNHNDHGDWDEIDQTLLFAIADEGINPAGLNTLRRSKRISAEAVQASIAYFAYDFAINGKHFEMRNPPAVLMSFLKKGGYPRPQNFRREVDIHAHIRRLFSGIALVK